MHQNAMIAAEAAMAANAQGKFFGMHESLLANQTTLTRDHILQLATELGLDMKRFTSDIDTHVYAAGIQVEVQEAMTAGAGGTPANFINGRFLSGAQPFEGFKRVIDEELARLNAGAGGGK